MIFMRAFSASLTYWWDRGSSLPYGYLADEISRIAEELSSPALEDISVSSLEDALFRLEIIASAPVATVSQNSE